MDSDESISFKFRTDCCTNTLARLWHNARKLEAEAAAPSMDNVRRGSHPRASGAVDPAPIGHAIMAALI